MLHPPSGCKACPKDDDMYEWVVTIDGPKNTPYEGGKFYLSMNFNTGFPFRPPKVKFLTHIYHCNISKGGDICLDILKSNWSAALSVSQILLSIWVLLQEPNPADPLEPDIAKQLMNEREEHDKIAREWTEKYAKNKNVIDENKADNNKDK